MNPEAQTRNAPGHFDRNNPMTTLTPHLPYATRIDARCASCGSRGVHGDLWPDPMTNMTIWCWGCGGRPEPRIVLWMKPKAG